MTIPDETPSRPFGGQRDLANMYELVAAAHDDALHVADLPWRLTSPSARIPERTRLWERADGTLLAWAVLQFPWNCLDYTIRPDARSDVLEESVLSWATSQLRAEAANREEPLPFYASAREDDRARIAALERAGFTPHGWSYIHMARNLDGPMTAPAPLDGFSIRAL